MEARSNYNHANFADAIGDMETMEISVETIGEIHYWRFILLKTRYLRLLERLAMAQMDRSRSGDESPSSNTALDSGLSFADKIRAKLAQRCDSHRVKLNEHCSSKSDDQIKLQTTIKLRVLQRNSS